MSFLSLLSKTYDNLQTIEFDKRRELLPIYHSTYKAHVEIMIDIDGNFIGASFVADVIGKEKNLSETLIPVTEKSASRSSGIAPHPLCDKIKYIAKDYKMFTGEENADYFEAYINQLEEWANSEYSTAKLKAIYSYINKGKLIHDLVNCNVLALDENGFLSKKWDNCQVKLTAGDQQDAVIRFIIHGDTENDYVNAWEDLDLQNKFIQFTSNENTDTSLCYITGENTVISESHPSKIRHAGDKAKLISANDTSGYTFRGRFETSSEAVQIGYETSQKAHNALKYLLKKQGERVGERSFLLWGTQNETVPVMNSDTFSFLFDDNKEFDTKEEFAKAFNSAILGYKNQININSEFAIIGIDAATTGRACIVYYKEYQGFGAIELIDNIQNWHEQMTWYHRYKKINFWGASAPVDIAMCSFGVERGDFIDCDARLVSKTIQRLLPCITDGVKIPRDIVNSAIKKCYSPQSYKKGYNFNKVLSVTCSLVKKYLYDYEKEVFDMSIKEDYTDIAYNCGRWLAVVDEIERRAMDYEDRTTNAMRYFSRFTRTPCDTKAIIEEKLVPYKNRLGARGNDLYRRLGEISSNIDPVELEKAKNLDGKMALGFDTQKNDMYKKEVKNEEEK